MAYAWPEPADTVRHALGMNLIYKIMGLSV
jgi:hypothetical protein